MFTSRDLHFLPDFRFDSLIPIRRLDRTALSFEPGNNERGNEESAHGALPTATRPQMSPRPIRKYLPKLPSSPTGNLLSDYRWSTFLKNHAQSSSCQLF
jgi:hypothetical protein